MNKIDPLISVIVPVYKVEKYLRRCVDSIIGQTYKNLEIILVDDGSPDSCPAICDEYARKDQRVKVIHKANGGQSTARNAALDIASGDYIGFVDSDDWIELGMYQALIDSITTEQADIIQCNWYKVDDSGIKREASSRFVTEYYTSDDGLNELISSVNGHLNTSVCCKLFIKEIAISCRFSPVRAYEDDEYIFKTVSCSKKIICIDAPLYNYLDRQNSTMTAKFNINKIALVIIQKNICELIRIRLPKRFNEVQKTLCSKQFYILYCIYNSDITNKEKYADRIVKDILASYPEYMANPRMGLNKLMLFIFKYMPRFVWQSALKLKFR